MPDSEAEKAPSGWPAPRLSCFPAGGAPASSGAAAATASAPSSYSYDGHDASPVSSPSRQAESPGEDALPRPLSSSPSPPSLVAAPPRPPASVAKPPGPPTTPAEQQPLGQQPLAEQPSAEQTSTGSKAVLPRTFGPGGVGFSGARITPDAQWTKAATGEPLQHEGRIDGTGFVKGVVLLLMGAAIVVRSRSRRSSTALCTRSVLACTRAADMPRSDRALREFAGILSACCSYTPRECCPRGFLRTTQVYALVRGRRAKRVRVQNSAIAAADVDLK